LLLSLLGFLAAAKDQHWEPEQYKYLSYS